MASQYPVVPVPHAVGLGVASTSASVSPSPFAPPPAPIAGPVSQSLPLPLSTSSLSHLTAKAKSPRVVRAHLDQLDLSSDLHADADEHPAWSEYVMEHKSASTFHPDNGEAGPGGNSTAGHRDAFTHDPPDQPQPRVPSQQVCLSSRAVLFPPACMHMNRVIESGAAAFGYCRSILVITLPLTAFAKDPFVPSFPV